MRRKGFSIQDMGKFELGPRAVECFVSNRWLEFPEDPKEVPGEGTALVVNVMTGRGEDTPRRLCQLIITREDLDRALEYIDEEAETQKE